MFGCLYFMISMIAFYNKFAESKTTSKIIPKSFSLRHKCHVTIDSKMLKYSNLHSARHGILWLATKCISLTVFSSNLRLTVLTRQIQISTRRFLHC